MEKRETTPQRQAKRKYEEKNKDERKQTSATFGTMIPRELFDEINAFLSETNITKVELVKAGYDALLKKVKTE